MGFKIKNSLTGEFEKLPILTLKGEKGETGGVEEYNKVDYMGNKYETLKQANDANVEYAVKTAIGEFNYLDYEGQHITATDTIEGRSKSAILKGNTLVNTFQFKDKNDFTFSNSVVIEGNVLAFNANGDYHNFWLKNNGLVKPNTTYLFCVDVIENTTTYRDGLAVSSTAIALTSVSSGSGQDSCFGNGLVITIDELSSKNKIIKTFKSNSELTGNEGLLTRAYVNPNLVSGTLKIRMMIIEYQEGMENWDIPYFEGMQSVKMPVLTTIGKNLIHVGRGYDDSLSLNGVTITRNSVDQTITFNGTCTVDNLSYQLDNFFNKKIKTGERYALSCYLVSGSAGNVSFRVNTKGWTNSMACELNKPHIKTFNSDMVYGACSFRINSGATFDNAVFKVMFEKIDVNSNTTTYEPYKSNILTVNEEVVLRSLPSGVCDTLNVKTGELTQRIGEITFDGTNKQWEVLEYPPHKNNTHYQFKYQLGEGVIGGGLWTNTQSILSNILPSANESLHWGSNGNYGIGGDGNSIMLTWKKDTSPFNDITTLNEWLKKNPLTVQYTLATPVVKTVDLSDNHVYSYKNITHYDCSSAEGSLIPTLSVKVPTDVQATIAQQRETIQTLNSENERLNQIQEALKASMLDSQVQLMNISWNTDFEVFTLRESIAPKDSLLDSRTGSNIDKFSQAKFIIENDCPDLEKLNSQIEYYFSKDVFSQEQFEELTDLISIVKGGNGCEY